MYFIIGKCSLGSVLVASTENGISAIFLGDNSDELIRNLRERFPRIDIGHDQKALKPILDDVIALIEDPLHRMKLPLDLHGTAFQMRVWQALLQLEHGSTTNYRQLAIQIGQPTAARAVAQACAANPIAVLIPCHRVLRSDRSLSGYRWGVQRKAMLLERERVSLSA